MPDEATAVGSPPRVFVDRVRSALIMSSIWWLLYWNTHFRVWCVFRTSHAHLEVSRVVRVSLEVGSVRARLLKSISSIAVSSRGRS